MENALKEFALILPLLFYDHLPAETSYALVEVVE
jgi:hypothetical protein